MRLIDRELLRKIKKAFFVRIESLKKNGLQRGTTFVEVLVTMAIIAILMTTITVSIIVFIPIAQEAVAKSNIGAIETAISGYVLTNNAYPDQGTWKEDIRRFIQSGIPNDPWGQEYIYKNPGPDENTPYEIRSKGRDTNEGTEDDIISWKLNEPPEKEK